MLPNMKTNIVCPRCGTRQVKYYKNGTVYGNQYPIPEWLCICCSFHLNKNTIWEFMSKFGLTIINTEANPPYSVAF